MTSTLSWWKMPVWACVSRFTVLWNRAISSWMKRTKRAWRSLVGAMASSFVFGLFVFSFSSVCFFIVYVPLIPLPEIVDQPGVDIFGQVYNQWKNKECECPNCKRLIAASRFAPHLEKCLGMGRNSSRIANRRSVSKGHSGLIVVVIQNGFDQIVWWLLGFLPFNRLATNNNMSKSESDQEDNDDLNDNDWSYGAEKKGEHLKIVYP